MTRGTFRTRVLQESRRCKGKTIYDAGDTSAINTLIDEQLDEVARRARAIPVLSAALTLVAGTGTYVMSATGLARRMAEVMDVAVDGQVILNYNGNAGAVSPQDVRIIQINPESEPNGRPRVWWNEGARLIRLWPAPDQVYSCQMTGWGLPSQPSSDTVEIDLPDALIEAAILWCAFVFCGRGSGYSAPEVMEMGELASGQMQAYRNSAAAKMFGRRARLRSPRAFGRM